MNRKFLNLFKNEKPILAMLHLKGTSDEDIVRRFKEEIAIYAENGVDCIIVENYFGNYRHMEMALDYISKLNLVIPYGVNCLNVDPMGFELAEKLQCSDVMLSVLHRMPQDRKPHSIRLYNSATVLETSR